MNPKYDVIIVGAGIAGCSLARELSRYNIRLAVLEKSYDIAAGASRSNSGIVHGGYDPAQGTLKSKYNLLGKDLFARLSEELGFRYEQRGTLVVAQSEEELDGLHELYERGKALGVKGLRLVDAEELHRLEPELNPSLIAGLLCESAGICDPFGMCRAYAENAASNGVEFLFNEGFQELIHTKEHDDDYFVIKTSANQELSSRFIVNAAGVHADEVARACGDESIAIKAVAGEYVVLSRETQGSFSRTIFMVPSKKGKGILVTPTVEGNTLVGPNAYELEDKDDLATHAQSLQAMIARAQQVSWPGLPRRHIIQNFTGVRPKPARGEDFIIGKSPAVLGLYHIAAFESPGLTCAPAVALELAEELAAALHAQPSESFNPRRLEPLRFIEMSNEERTAAIAQNPDYARIICRCEQVSKAEILECMRSSLPVFSIEAIKRRCRAGTGGCQGGFCAPLIAEIIADECGISLAEVKRAGEGSELAPYRCEGAKLNVIL